MICISHATAVEQCYITRVSPRGTTELKHIINVPADSNNFHAKRETLAQTDMSLFKFLENQYFVIDSQKLNKLTLEKMSWHCIQWLLSCNLLSYFVCTVLKM